MRVAQLMAGAPSGGAELFFERVCAALARAGDEVLPVVRRDPARLARLRASGLSPCVLGFGGRLDFSTRWRAGRALRRFGPRVAVAWMGRAARHAPRGPWVLVGRLGGYYDLRQFARCDHLVGNTRGMVDWILSQGWAPGRVHLLPNFVPDLAGVAPAKLPVPKDRPVVLAMGRLHRNKGFDILVGAISRLPGVHAVIAGEGPERDGLERLSRHAGVADRVHFLGWRQDTGALLAACDVLACPSRSEPLGNVVLEAFSAGRPVVASLADGPRELIESGRTGVLARRDHAAAMAQAARKLYEASFSEAAVVQGWREFLSHVSAPK